MSQTLRCTVDSKFIATIRLTKTTFICRGSQHSGSSCTTWSDSHITQDSACCSIFWSGTSKHSSANLQTTLPFTGSPCISFSCSVSPTRSGSEISTTHWQSLSGELGGVCSEEFYHSYGRCIQGLSWGQTFTGVSGAYCIWVPQSFHGTRLLISHTSSTCCIIITDIITLLFALSCFQIPCPGWDLFFEFAKPWSILYWGH